MMTGASARQKFGFRDTLRQERAAKERKGKPALAVGVSHPPEFPDLADALGFLRRCASLKEPGASMDKGSQAPFRRLLQALQNFGQVIPFSTLPPAFASRHSTPHFF
jgi:hypothetical protein